MPDDTVHAEASAEAAGVSASTNGAAPLEEAARADEAPVFSTPRLEAIRAPISASAPAGGDMKYDDDFQALKAGVDALGAATGNVDFGAIVGLATMILSERSKDFTAASYLMLGLTRTDGFAGIAEGLAAVRAVTEGFWDSAYPPLKRMRGRQAALQFVAERTSAWMKDEDHRATLADRESLVVAQAELESLQAFVTEAMGDDAPTLSGLSREIREAVRRLPEPEPDPPEDEPAAEPEDAGASSAQEGAPESRRGEARDEARTEASPPAASVPTPSVAVRQPAEARGAVLAIANVLSEADLLNATAFTLRRAVLWGTLVQAPPPGVFPPPPQMRRDAFDTMLAAANYTLFVEQAESFLPQHPFPYWLDLQRLVATALKAQGAPARAAVIAVESATAAFVKRLPEIPALAFNDGTPFADPLTLAWLGELAGGGGDSAAGDDDATALAIQAAREQADEGDVPGAVGALMAGAGATRDRFERAVAAANLCLSAGRPDVALGLLDDAAEIIGSHALDTWDPEASAKAYRLIHTCASATNDHGRAMEAFQKLTRLDPGHTMRSKPPSDSGY